MSIIQIDCPVCGQALELDGGFAGGVCRCSACGALMTVPRQLGEKAQKLTRPDWPGHQPNLPPDESASQRPETPHHSMDFDPDRLTAAQVPMADRPDRPWPQSPKNQPVNVLATASGQLITIIEQAIPTAHRSRRRAVWITSMLAATALMAAIFAALWAFHGLTHHRPINPAIGFGFDPDDNPLLREQPNLLGLPMDQSTVLVIDHSLTLAENMPLLQRYLPTASARLVETLPWQIILTDDSQPRAYPDRLRVWTPLDIPNLREQLTAATPAAHPSLWMTIEHAMRSHPRRIILLTSQPQPKPELEQLIYSLDRTPNLRLDVICLGFDSPPLRRQAQQRGGQYLCLPPAQLAAWLQWTGAPRP